MKRMMMIGCLFTALTLTPANAETTKQTLNRLSERFLLMAYVNHYYALIFPLYYDYFRGKYEAYLNAAWLLGDDIAHDEYPATNEVGVDQIEE